MSTEEALQAELDRINADYPPVEKSTCTRCGKGYCIEAEGTEFLCESCVETNYGHAYDYENTCKFFQDCHED